MDTEEELAGALAALQRRSMEELAAFIVSLLYDPPPDVRSYVEAFIAAAEPAKVATIVRREIGVLRSGERDYLALAAPSLPADSSEPPNTAVGLVAFC